VSYLRYLYLFAHCGVRPTHIMLCFDFIFLCLVCTVLTVSLECLFLIAPSVFCNVYFQKGSVVEQTFNFNVSEAKFFFQHISFLTDVNYNKVVWCLFISLLSQCIADLHDWLSPYHFEG